MKYNKEYIEQLLQRFMDGETTEQEEQFLTEYFSTSDSIPEEWEAYRELFASFSTDAYDFTEEELIEAERPTPTLHVRDGEQQRPKLQLIKMWPWFAAACIAALMIVFLAPPQREETQQMAKVEKTITPQKEVDYTVKTVTMPRPSNEEKQLAQVAVKKTSTPQYEPRNSKSKQKEGITEPKLSENELAKTDEPITDEEKLMAEQMSQFKEMEAAFLSHSAPIRERGQQVMHRVAMLQQEQRNQQQFVEL